MHSTLNTVARPSGCPLRGCISEKRLKLGFRNFHHKVVSSLRFLRDNFHPELQTGSPDLIGDVKQGCVEKTSYFLSLCVNTLYIENSMSNVIVND